MSEISINVDRGVQFGSTGVENWQRLFKIVYCLIFGVVYIILFLLCVTIIISNHKITTLHVNKLHNERPPNIEYNDYSIYVLQELQIKFSEAAPITFETLYVHRNTNILITDIIRNYNRMRFLNAIITCHNNYFTMEFRLRLQVQSGCIKQTITHSSFTKTNWSVRRQNVAWAGISLALWMMFFVNHLF